MVLQVAVKICGFVMHGGVKFSCADLDAHVKEGNRVLQHIRCEAQSWVKCVGKLCEFRNIITRTRESTKNIIDVTSVHQRPDALILGQHLFFYVTDKQTSITRSHPRTHSHTTGLNVVLTVEREVVQC